MSRFVPRGVLALVLAVGACSNAVDQTLPASTVAEIPLNSIPSGYDEFRARPAACGAETPPPAVEMTFPAPGDMGIPIDSRPVATITTSCGDIVVELEPSMAPETVNSFVFLASKGYFDGTVSHRIVPGFVVQAGDPTATGLGGPGYVIPDEFPDDEFRYDRGVVAMANAGSGTGGSQFFIALGDTGLAPEFSVFGEVVAGEDVLALIGQIPVGPGAREVSVPLETLFIESIVVDVS